MVDNLFMIILTTASFSKFLLVPKFILQFPAAHCWVNDETIVCLAEICRTHSLKVRAWLCMDLEVNITIWNSKRLTCFIYYFFGHNFHFSTTSFDSLDNYGQETPLQAVHICNSRFAHQCREINFRNQCLLSSYLQPLFQRKHS